MIQTSRPRCWCSGFGWLIPASVLICEHAPGWFDDQTDTAFSGDSVLSTRRAEVEERETGGKEAGWIELARSGGAARGDRRHVPGFIRNGCWPLDPGNQPNTHWHMLPLMSHRESW